MNTHPNINLVNTFFNAYLNNDMNGIKGVLSENIKWHIPGTHPLSGTKSGINEVLEYFNLLSKANFKAEAIVIGANDDYVIDCHKNWSNLENDENLNNTSCLLWKIKENKIIEVLNFPENQYKVDIFFSKLYS